METQATQNYRTLEVIRQNISYRQLYIAIFVRSAVIELKKILRQKSGDLTRVEPNKDSSIIHSIASVIVYNYVQVYSQ